MLTVQLCEAERKSQGLGAIDMSRDDEQFVEEL